MTSPRVLVPQSCITMLVMHATRRDPPVPATMIADARSAIADNWPLLHPDRRAAIAEFIRRDCADRRLCATTTHGDAAYCERQVREANEWDAWLDTLEPTPHDRLAP